MSRKHTAPGTQAQHRHQAIDTRNDAYKGVMREERTRADRRGLGQRQRQVYEALVRAGPNGATNHELSEATGLPANVVTPRTYELRGLGEENPLSDDPLAYELRRDGTRIKRPTPTGSKAQVWVAKPFAGRRAPTPRIEAVDGCGRLTELHRTTIE